MKIFVVNNMCPFIHGGAEDLADYLVTNLSQLGHDVRLCRIPFRYEPPEQIFDEMVACKFMRLSEADLVIAMKFPAYLIPHPNKVLWLVHQYRQAYDMWDSGSSNIPGTQEGCDLRKSISLADSECFRSVKRLCAISPIIQKRLRKYNGIESELLRTPINGPEDFKTGAYGDYMFCGGRINATKRQHMLVEAMSRVRSNAKLVIAGPADSEVDANRLMQLVEKYGLRDRVILDIGFHARRKIADLVTNSLACAYLPIDEDSLGYVSMEANQAGKAVLTCTDAGGLLDLVCDQETGWVCEPNVNQIAQSIDAVFDDRNRTAELGMAARERWLKMGINWGRIAESLVA